MVPVVVCTPLMPEKHRRWWLNYGHALVIPMHFKTPHLSFDSRSGGGLYQNIMRGCGRGIMGGNSC